MKIFIVRTRIYNDIVELEPVVAFTTRRVAETVVRRRKAKDAYTYQYDDVLELDMYETESRWKRGIKVQAAIKLRKEKR